MCINALRKERLLSCGSWNRYNRVHIFGRGLLITTKSPSDKQSTLVGGTFLYKPPKGTLGVLPLACRKFGWANRKDLYPRHEEYGGILRNYWLGRWQDFVWRDVTETFASDKLHIHRCCKIRLFFSAMSSMIRPVVVFLFLKGEYLYAEKTQ